MFFVLSFVFAPLKLFLKCDNCNKDKERESFSSSGNKSSFSLILLLSKNVLIVCDLAVGGVSFENLNYFHEKK